MKIRLYLPVLFFLIGGSILSACGAPAAMEAPPATQAGVISEGFAAQAPAAEDAAKEQPGSTSGLPAAPIYNTGGSPEDPALAAAHMIVKNADIKLLVEDTDVAIDRATQAVGDAGGYIISSRVWYQTWQDGVNYKYATISIGVPVDQFERMLSRLRGFAVRVEDETASGEDVTDQYVDLQSQLTNLEATRERIKAFLDQATNVDEALRVNQELANVEAQIEQIQGRINYLKDRSAYSTITINFEPVLPDLTPAPTPTPRPWTPGKTFEESKTAVTLAYQGILDFLIRFCVVVIPIFAPPAFIIWAIWRWLNRKPTKPASGS